MKRIRTSLSSYPLLWLALLAFSGVLSVYFLPRIALWLNVGLFLLLFAMLLLRKRHPVCLRYALISLLLLLCTLHASYLFIVKEAKFLAYDQTETTTTICIHATENENDFYALYSARVTEWDGEKAPSGIYVLLRTIGNDRFQEGDILSGRFSCSLPEERSYGFPSRLYQRAKGILLYLEPTDEPIAFLGTDDPSAFTDWINRVQDTLSARLSRSPSDVSALSHALLLGDKSFLSANVSRDFSKIGASHILAISGMHLSVFCGLLFLFLNRFPLSKIWRTVLLCPFLLFICFLTDVTPSVLRSALMITLAALFSLFRRRVNGLETLSVVGFLFAFFLPHFLLHIGFLLSFFATLGIVSLLPKKKRPKGLLRKAVNLIITSIHASLAAVLFTLPIVALFFGRLSLLGPISTLLLMPLCILSIYSALLLLPLPNALCATWLTDSLLSLPQRWMLLLSARLCRMDNLSVYFVDRIDFLFVCLFAVSILLFLLFGLTHRRTALALLLSICLLLYPIHLYQNPNKNCRFSFRIYADGQDEVILLSDGESTLLFDCSKTDYDLCKTALSALHNEYRTDVIDAFICLAYADTQTKNLPYLLSNHYVDTLYFPKPRTAQEQEKALSIASLAQIYGCHLIYYESQQTLGAFTVSFARNETFTLTGYETTLAYFNEYWNQTQYQVERYTNLYYRYSGRVYFLFSCRTNGPTSKNLSDADCILSRSETENPWRIEIPISENEPHKNFLFVA